MKNFKEFISELSKEKLGSYVKKAWKDREQQADDHVQSRQPESSFDKKRLSKRMKGQDTAMKKIMAKEDFIDEAQTSWVVSGDHKDGAISKTVKAANARNAVSIFHRKVIKTHGKGAGFTNVKAIAK